MKKRILSNVSFNFLIKIITYTFSLLTFLYAARVLCPETFGRISFASAVAGYFVMIANLGMPIYAMRTCAEKREDRQELNRAFHELWSINVLLSAVSAAVFLGIILTVPKLKENTSFLLVFGSSVFFQMIGCEWLYKGLEQFRLLGLCAFVCKAISFLLILLFVHSESDGLLYAVLSVLTAYGSHIVCFFLLPRYVDIPLRLTINKRHFKPLLTFFMMSCAVYVYSSLDLVMLGFMKGDYITGLYTIAAKGKSVLAITGGLVWNSTLPIAAKLWADGEKEQFESLAAKTTTAVCGIQLVVTIICLLLSEQIMLFVGGESYRGAARSFRILLLSLVPIGASNILGGQVLIPAGKEKRLLQAEILGAIFNFAANLILIPRFSMEGAAVTTTISEIIVWIVCLYYVKQDLDMDLWRGVAERIVRRSWMAFLVFRVKAQDQLFGERLPYDCPCCDTHLRRFIQGSYDKKMAVYNPDRYKSIDQNVICPICKSLPRHRILVFWMKKNKEILLGRDILHFAQEKSVRLWMDRNGMKAVTADLYHDADLHIDIQNTGLDAECYDIVICNHVLEHVDDFRQALKEVYRILRPGGSFICSFPMDPTVDLLYENALVKTQEDRRHFYGQIDHKRVFGMHADRLLAEAGFSVEMINGKDCPQEILPVVGPADYDMNMLFRCVKGKD